MLIGPAPAKGRQTLLIRVDGLRPGMFVAELDRPWLGTGFPLEGVRLGTAADVRRIQAMCRHVRVDTLRGVEPALHYVVQEEPPPATTPAKPAPFRGLLSRVFGAEVAAAQAAHTGLETDVREVMDGLRDGGKLDADRLREGVDTMLDSITRNPGALPWVLEMRRKGDYIYQHGLACSIWAAAFGRHLGFEREDLRDLALGALLCDVGKVRLSGELLSKTGRVTAEELGQLRSHVAESRRIVAETRGLSPMVARIVEHHHERHDGSGYPGALRGNAIPMPARIAGLVDSFDAMVSQRPYADSRSPHQAVMELYQARDRLFQAELVEQFIRTCGVYPTGTLVELTDGSVGVVMSVNTLKRLRPTVMLLLDASKRPLDDFRLVDLAEVLDDADGEPLNVRGGLPQGAYGIDRAALFLD
ncbi:HD-GYP domain-containing protein [Cognatilysobacter lacus]|uniref:HD-GYP domain-containing protein n=1 Tax=Cognatilysobacter lacus TaxID=1643323 RepID=A0A5D8ZAM5_9GAMM|nr:HD-GYP domain-containing protein [Lysobacter lacus]TZF91861.1 HD-GYP domain-containing protein [Lysobacter lacus]